MVYELYPINLQKTMQQRSSDVGISCTNTVNKIKQGTNTTAWWSPLEQGVVSAFSTPLPTPKSTLSLCSETTYSLEKCNTARAHWEIQGWAAIPFYVKEPWESPPRFGLCLLNAVAPVQRNKGKNYVYPALASRGSMSSEMLPLSGSERPWGIYVPGPALIVL